MLPTTVSSLSETVHDVDLSAIKSVPAVVDAPSYINGLFKEMQTVVKVRFVQSKGVQMSRSRACTCVCVRAMSLILQFINASQQMIEFEIQPEVINSSSASNYQLILIRSAKITLTALQQRKRVNSSIDHMFSSWEKKNWYKCKTKFGCVHYRSWTTGYTCVIQLSGDIAVIKTASPYSLIRQWILTPSFIS